MSTGKEILIALARVPEPDGTDEELVREALKRYRSFMSGHQFGLLAYQYKLSRVALEAFERLIDPQTSFLRWANWGGQDVDEFYED